MEIIAISDTHIKKGSLSENLPAPLLSMLKSSDMVIHAGSFETLESYRELAGIKRLVAVRGDLESRELEGMLPESAVFEVEGIRIGVVHRGRHVTNITNMRYLAKEMGVGILVFGHLHRPLIDRSDVLLVCPGSPTQPRMSVPSAVELRIEKGRVTGNIIAFEGKVCDYLEQAGRMIKG